MAARVPFGYEIVDGKAQVNAEAAERLKLFFSEFLSGASMAEAARKARLQCSTTTYPHLFKRKEYSGTDYYPAIITPEYQQQLIAEWEKRKGEAPRRGNTHTPKGVPLYTEFRVFKDRMCGDRELCRDRESADPAAVAAAIYQRIRPRYKNNTTS